MGTTICNLLDEKREWEPFENGKIKVNGKYVHGKKQGAWKEYNEEEKVINTEVYKDGELKK